MNNQQNNNLGMVFGSHLGLGAVASPYTQKALEERLKMIADLQVFLKLVCDMAPTILERMQSVEQKFYTQASDMIKQDAYTQFATGAVGLATTAVGFGAGEFMNGRAGAKLNQEADILKTYSTKLKSPYQAKSGSTRITPENNPPLTVSSEKLDGDVSLPGDNEEKVLKTNPEQAKMAGDKFLQKSETDPQAGNAKARTQLRAMGKKARDKEFDELDRNSMNDEALRKKYAKKFEDKAEILSKQGQEKAQKANSFMQATSGISQLSGFVTGAITLNKAKIQLEQAETAAAKQANSMIDSQYGKLGNDSIDQLQAFVKSLDSQISIDSQINQQRG